MCNENKNKKTKSFISGKKCKMKMMVENMKPIPTKYGPFCKTFLDEKVDCVCLGKDKGVFYFIHRLKVKLTDNIIVYLHLLL